VEDLQSLKDLARRDYGAYLLTTHWRRTRERLFALRGEACEACGTTAALHVHHRSYRRIGHEALDDLQILCRECHSAMHPHRRQEPDVIDFDFEADEADTATEWWEIQVAEWLDNVRAAPSPPQLQEPRQLEDAEQH
jgi:hypothetical protein